MNHLFNGIASVLELLLNIVQLVIIAHIVISWLNAPAHNPIVQMVNAVVEPLLKPFRKISQKLPGPIDWAPMIVILIIIFLNASLVRYLKGLAYAPF